jgi:biopolymer transport protein ExbD
MRKIALPEGESSNPVQINIIPVANVIFCLLIFFMCSFHFKRLEGKIESWLPKDEGIGPGIGRVNPLVEKIRVHLKWDPIRKQTIRIFGGKEYKSDELLVTEIKRNYLIARELTGSREEVPVVIEGDPSIPWQDVITIMDLCKREKMHKIELAVTVPVGK